MDKKKMKEIWEVLTGDDANSQVNAALERRENNLSYLSWSDCWGILKGHFPASRYVVEKTIFYPDGSAAAVVTLEIDGESHTEHLPVMAGTRHSAIKNPDARQIGDGEKRCLVKAAAHFGLGLWVYRGEDVPPKAKEDEPKTPVKPKAKPKAKAKAKAGPSFMASELARHALGLESVSEEAKRLIAEVNEGLVKDLTVEGSGLRKDVQGFEAQARKCKSKDALHALGLSFKGLTDREKKHLREVYESEKSRFENGGSQNNATP